MLYFIRGGKTLLSCAKMSYEKKTQIFVAPIEVLASMVAENGSLEVDFDVPLTEDGQISSHRRIRSALPIIQYLKVKEAINGLGEGGTVALTFLAGKGLTTLDYIDKIEEP